MIGVLWRWRLACSPPMIGTLWAVVSVFTIAVVTGALWAVAGAFTTSVGDRPALRGGRHADRHL
jgi:hypothetical protein